jgi:methylmalonyl-CoA mutase N-terminal domain/subunit
LKHFKSQHSQSAVQKALDGLSDAAENKDINIIEKTVKPSDSNVTHGEICRHWVLRLLMCLEGVPFYQ